VVSNLIVYGINHNLPDSFEDNFDIFCHIHYICNFSTGKQESLLKLQWRNL